MSIFDKCLDPSYSLEYNGERLTNKSTGDTLGMSSSIGVGAGFLECGMRDDDDDDDKTKQQLVSELRQCREEFKKFTYIVSHDLRTPLINLKGFSAELRFALETVQSALDPLLPHLDDSQRPAVTTAIQEDIPESLEFIEFSVKRIDNFMNAVLRLSRMSRRELKLEPLDMDALVQNTLETLAEQIGQRQVEVAVKSPLPEVIADRDSMNEVMGILLKNAVVYLDSSRPGEIEVAGKQDSKEAIFTIRDNGRGIAAEDMHKIFEPFRRAGRQDVPGEGMGLVYAQTLARLHGGSIKCASELGVGSEFTFTVSSQLVQGGDHA
ncbi:MAG: HAMP domain-containing histidine kinase [Anaerolineae bacterium]|jgi:signal transduction histidine kinase|nr:HAMP domain-containing histidine kinase [Anaerolineae bacterium]